MNGSLPTLSIVIPNFNHGKYLPAAINAIVKQSVQPAEVVIIDDGSADNSVQILQRLAAENPVIRFYRNDKNQGAVFTINRGIDLATSEYVFLAAADDEIMPGFLEKSLRVLAQYPQAGLSCTIGDWREVATGLNWHVGVGMADSPTYLSPERMVELERRGRFYIPGHTAVMKRTALIEAGKCIPELKMAVDWFNNYVIGFRYGICYVPEPLAIFNIHPNSYYKKSRRDPRLYREVLEEIMRRLTLPENRDVAERIREAGCLYSFASPMLKVLRSKPEYRRFITPTFLRKNLWHSTRLILKKFTPAPLGNFYFKLAGMRAATPSHPPPSRAA
jgi:glycosyltransferase involved in cell wall biosynthesis